MIAPFPLDCDRSRASFRKDYFAVGYGATQPRTSAVCVTLGLELGLMRKTAPSAYAHGKVFVDLNGKMDTPERADQARSFACVSKRASWPAG